MSVTLVQVMKLGAHDNTVLRPGAGLNVILGSNATGKTTFLRALSTAIRAPHENAINNLNPSRRPWGDYLRSKASSASVRVHATNGVVGIDIAPGSTHVRACVTGDLHLPTHTVEPEVVASIRSEIAAAASALGGGAGRFVSGGERCLNELLTVAESNAAVSLWEHPEACLVGESLRVFARSILRLGCGGTQVFVSTRDYGFLKELELSTAELAGEVSNGPKAMYHSFSRSGDSVRVESSGAPFAFSESDLASWWGALFDREVRRSLSGGKKQVA